MAGLAVCALGAWLPMGVVLAGESEPAWRGEARIELGAGYSGEARYDPLLDLAAVPGGGFIGLSPWGRLSRRVGTRGSLALSGMADLEQYPDDDSRSFLGVAGAVDLTLAGSGRLYGRFTLGAQYFNDSEIETARRDGAGGRAALGRAGRRGGVELGLGAWRRSYPDLTVAGDQGRPETYDETAAVADVLAYRRLGGGTLLRGELNARFTDGTGTLYDAVAWYGRIDAGWEMRRLWSLWLTALAQKRTFDERAPGGDSDDYAQLGARVERALGKGPSLGLQAAWARYGETDGSSDDTWRGGLYLAWRLGRGRVAAPGGDTAGLGRVEGRAGSGAAMAEHDVAVAPGRVTFRIRRPGAATVSVVGDFNGWDPARHPLQSAPGGWWQLSLELGPGSYQYAYVVDGALLTPPAAPALVDDGFGGRNGLFTVPPPPVTSQPEARLSE